MQPVHWALVAVLTYRVLCLWYPRLRRLPAYLTPLLLILDEARNIDALLDADASDDDVD